MRGTREPIEWTSRDAKRGHPRDRRAIVALASVAFALTAGCKDDKKEAQADPQTEKAKLEAKLDDSNEQTAMRTAEELTRHQGDTGAPLPENAAERPATRMPPPGKPCPISGNRCPSCDDVSQSIDEVIERLKYLGIPASTYSLGDSDAGTLGYQGTIIIVDAKNESLIRLALEGKFERFFDATAAARKKHTLTTEQARAEFDNLRLGLMGHIWCDGARDTGKPTRSSVAHRVAFAFVNRAISFQRVSKLEDKYGWSWPPGFKPLGYTALGGHEQLLEKVYESGDGLSGGEGYGYAVLRKSGDEMIDLRDRVKNVLADFVFVLDLTCNDIDRDEHPFPCTADGLDFPTMVLRDPKTKRVFLIQEGLKADED